ncbi:hypothetical protein DZ860_17610 [Vibrio sinensis]|uniref:Uncharacterized protein n=1 Tax=Vibrio sinensis TaxID=2302434 RepID=A0A3A6QG59_9VIBR|nr:hypothetical protein [Vibrio sinensis]RJX68342.1 hypothetical protein DZ860_17610 [Vibrio sinensis]
MNLIGLQLDDEAQVLVSELLDGLEEQDGWFKMAVRMAAQIDTKLRECQYAGCVKWFSESDFIEKEIVYI